MKITRQTHAMQKGSAYLKNNPPYRAPHQNMASVSELRLVNGISVKLYLALLPPIHKRSQAI